jgi:large subunit ribosomal protein L9
MEVILKESLKNLGEIDELVKVKAGYARNYLFPRGYAILATESSKKMLTETVKQRQHKITKLLKEAQQIADALKDVVIQVGAKVGESGKIFGSVNNIQVAEALKKKGFEIDRKQISLPEDHIKMIGTYTANITLSKDVKFPLSFEVVAE